MHVLESAFATHPAAPLSHANSAAGAAQVGGSTMFTRIAQAMSAVALLAVAGGAPAYAVGIDPPGFAPVPLKGTQAIGLNVTCFEHQVGEVLPSRCLGELMFHDAAGRELKRGSYELEPGQSMTLRLVIPATNAEGDPIRRVLIIPCLIPAPGGRAIPSVEVFDREAGRMTLFANPAAARMSAFNNDPADPGGEVGFDPQPDPPAFAMATLRGDQTMRMNVFCFEHSINGLPQQSCRGAVMFHDAAGNVLRRGVYDLAPGQSRSFTFNPSTPRPGALIGIVPCIVPDGGGRAVPNIEVTNGAGDVLLLINPAVARMSQFQQQELPR